MFVPQAGAAGEKGASNGVATSVISHTSRAPAQAPPANGAHTNGTPHSYPTLPLTPPDLSRYQRARKSFAGVSESPEDVDADENCDVDMSPPHEVDHAHPLPHTHEPHANGSHQGTERPVERARPPRGKHPFEERVGRIHGTRQPAPACKFPEVFCYLGESGDTSEVRSV